MNLQIDNKTTKQVRIDTGVHKILKIEATKAGKSIREYLEGVLTEHWDKENVSFYNL
ncbi:MAG: hypothetical protein ABH819_03110 [Patescibacteria group bacterium]